MKKKVRRGNLAVRALAIVVTFSMVVSLMTVLGGEASAATSLSGIEDIKNRKSLSILEIVPQEGTGSIGYYVAGREPTNGWLNVLAGKATANERDQYAENLLSSLKNANLMDDKGTSDAEYPLIYTGNYTTNDGYYKEYLPWEDRPVNAYAVDLTQAEEAKVKGSFTTAEAGDYIEANTYELKPGGDYVENALYYVYGDGNSEVTGVNYYYYRLSFTKVDPKNTPISDLFGVPLYTLVEDSLVPGNIYYRYAGTLENRTSVDHDDFTIDENTDYYKATVIQDTPTTTWEHLDKVTFTADELTQEKSIPEGHDLIGSTLYTIADKGYTPVQIQEGTPIDLSVDYYKLKENAHNYHAVTPSNPPFINAETPGTGFFDKKPGYKFVGDGKGDRTFKPSSTGSLWTLLYDTIYVTGGYTNGNWFKRYVLDMDPNTDDLTSMRISVTSVTPNQLTDVMVKNANLVVVSAGFDRTKQGSTVAYTRDITNPTILNELTKKPRVVDSRISGNVTNLASLGDGTTNPGVKVINNVDVYNFAAGSGTDERSALATKQFHTPFSTTTPYQVVADEITYVNLLRRTMNQEPLSTEISMATCIRYLLNAHLPVNHKTELRVLDIQPNAKRYTTDSTLSVATVQSWLPEKAFTNDKIKITHMSSAELICNIEDLAENYDLIYIGASQVGYNLPSGMYYANIGAKVTTTAALKGLMANHDHDARYSGNDLTPQKQKELLKFANSGLPIVVADALTSGLTTTQERKLTATISAKDNETTLKVTPMLTPSASNVRYEYQWYKYTTDPNDAEPVGNGETTYTPSTPAAGDHYFCTVTATIGDVTRSADSNTMRYTHEANTNSGYKLTKKSHSYWNPHDNDYFSVWSIEDELDKGKLTVKYDQNDSNVYVEKVTYTWYTPNTNNNGQIGGDSITANKEGTYYCKIKIEYWRKNKYGDWKKDNVTFTSPAYEATKTGGSTSKNYYTQASAGSSGIFESAISGTVTLDPTKVDGHSLMYEALNSVWSLPNVVVQKTVQREDGKTPSQALIDKQHTLLQHLNLSRPSIAFDYPDPKDPTDTRSYPTSPEYGGNLSNLTTYNCRGNLYFRFTIQNPTDPTPLQTKYTCNLYIDQNGDGRHDPVDEKIGGLNLSATGTTPVNGELVADTMYELNRAIGQQYTGIIAWKLEIVKVGDETACGSQKGYAYNHPASATPINVLQIMPILWNDRHSGYKEEPEGVNLKTDSYFQNLYAQLKQHGMYDISVTTVNVADLNNKKVGSTTYTDWNDLYNRYLSQFNMLVIGFDDCYHDLNTDTGRAIEKYIGSGRAVLFTHDTTSFFNVATESQAHSGYYRYWGYTFNQFIRDKVGLDRYGVTNPTYGKFDNGAGTVSRGEIAQGNDGLINENEATALRSAGYTVAYLPYTDSATKRSAGATHGFTNLNIYRYGGGASDELKTNKVSQVNRGMVTEFPFQMNKELTVSLTHSQYYQLNMNADDIVVWYCLSGTGGNVDGEKCYNYEANYYNDGTNAYYIYNRGNITYSGAGHKKTLTPDEKTLFVNTMVAAYRAAHTAPTVQFVTASGYDTSTQLVTAEDGTSLNMNQPFFFKLTDTNLTASKRLSVELYYEVADTSAPTLKDAGLDAENTEIHVRRADLGDIYRADTGAQVSNTNNLSSGIIYRTLLPQAVLDKFPPDASDLTIYLKVITKFNNDNNNTLSGKDDLKLQKLGLLRLE